MVRRPAPLAPGQYTAQATQANVSGINGVSAPTTSASSSRAPGQPGSGSSQQQTPGDRDGDGIPDDQDTSDGSLPPVPGKTFDARVISGDVFIKYPPGTGPRAVTPPKGFVPLKGAANIPIGSQLDTRKGRVAVTSAADSGGSKTQTAEFYDGDLPGQADRAQEEAQEAGGPDHRPGPQGRAPRSQCAPPKGAAAAAAKKKKRGAKSVLGALWGSGKGKFRTNGKYSSATVRGTIWLAQDRCDGTLTTRQARHGQRAGLQTQRTVSVKAGHSYLARADQQGKRRTSGAARVSMATDARIGSELAGYRIEASIGRGGMGVVYRAEQLRLGRQVALKLLAPELAKNQGFRARFEHESRLAAAIDHPNIVPLFEAGEADGLLFISMRYVEGTDLRALLAREGRLEPERALAIAAQVAGALDAAHDARASSTATSSPATCSSRATGAPDVPEHCYLTDFGLTKDTSAAVELTATGTFVGTIDYIAPEQIEGAKPDGRGDQYSLACVLFECLTGHPPFPRDEEVA